MAVEEGLGFCAEDALLAVHDQHLERAEDADPAGQDGRAQRLRAPVAGVGAVAQEELGGVPAVGTIHHVPDWKLAEEEDVPFYLSVGSYDQLDRRCRSRSSVSPGAALATGVDDASDHLGDRRGALRRAQDLLHLRARRVPPSYVQLAQLTADLRSISGP